MLPWVWLRIEGDKPSSYGKDPALHSVEILNPNGSLAQHRGPGIQPESTPWLFARSLQKAVPCNGCSMQ